MPQQAAGPPLSLTAIDSSDLEAVGYNPDLEIMDVKFKKSGRTRRFYNVGPLIYHGLISAKSKGAYFATFIRNHYTNCDL